MRIAILGTKGIPNNYGGFEQFAEYLSVGLAARGHDVTVYNPSFHPYRESKFKGVHVLRIYDPEKWIGGAANFIYDHLSLRHALRCNYDVIYEAGYHSMALSYKLQGVRKLKHPLIFTNMDGIEWKRSKWSGPVRKLIQRLEKIAVRESPYLVSDNPGIRDYYLREFNRDSFFIPYGADAVYSFDPGRLSRYGLKAGEYAMLIARMEPENNIEMILQSHVDAGSRFPFIVIGGYTNKFGKLMHERFSSSVRFLGGIYDKNDLDSLRHFSKAYVHGHSVGGTNPSLLEAMANNCFIMAHANPFNRGVLGDNAIYFSSREELTSQFKDLNNLKAANAAFAETNFKKIENDYSWDAIVSKHVEIFESLMKG
jgi:glycosyltransferase involved in cell wall biosynthesis